MLQENSPVYDAYHGRGLIARYSINFDNDASHVIPLLSAWQGDPVYAKTLHIMNYNIASNITVTVDNAIKFIPAYSDSYISLANAASVNLVADSGGIVPVEILNYFVAENVTLQPTVPNSVDANFADVVGLWHFEANNGTTIAVNSKATVNNTNFVLHNGRIISDGESYFGSSAAYTTGLNAAPGGTLTASADSVFVNTDPATLEFKIFATAPPNTNVSNVFTIGNMSVNVVPAVGLGSYSLTVSGGAATLSNVGMEFDRWYSGAIVGVNNYSALFIDGIQKSSNTFNFSVNAVTDWLMFNSGTGTSLYLDELRASRFARYLKNYMVSSLPFPDR